MKLRSLAWLLVPALIGTGAYAARAVDWHRLWAIIRGTPVLECPAVVELGDRELGEVAVARLTIANRGARELVIDEMQSNCACSGLEREQEGKFIRLSSLRLAPNEQAELIMRVLVQGSPGSPSQSRVAFRTNDPARPSAAIDTFVSKVKAGVNTVPTSVIFGTLSAESDACIVLDVFDSAIPARSIERVAALHPDRASVRLLPLAGNLPGANRDELGALIGRLEITATTNSEGPLENDVEIYLTGERRPPTLIPVSGRVAGPVEISPSMLVLPRSSGAGKVFFGQCVCRSTAGQPLALTVASVPSGLVAQVEAIEGNPSEQIIRIEWNPADDGDSKPELRRKVELKARVEGKDVKLGVPVICIRKGGG